MVFFRIRQIADDCLSLLLSKRDSANGEVPDFREVLYLTGLEMVSYVALETRLGFLQQDGGEMGQKTRVILDSIRGYQTASNRTMYGIPLWKWLPSWFPGCLHDLIAHKDRLYEVIGAFVDEKLEATHQVE